MFRNFARYFGSSAIMAQDLSQHIDLDNPEFQQVWSMICNTRRSVFLTGRAGTGKSTFLRYICAHTRKKYVVLAPTGIAAVNVGGQTLHSFFKIPFKPLLPDDPDFAPRRIRKTLRYPANKVKLIKNLDLIIIDEISMVRADVIDFVDKVLRIYSGNMREPFGGKQLLFVGDIFQLEPVVTRDMRDILQRFYRQFFFFNARVFDQLGLVPIELRRIYRQTDQDFVALLDRIRVAHVSQEDINRLNDRCNPDYVEPNDAMVVTLATRRDTVDAINDEHMAALDTPEVVFEGTIDGTFPDSDLPTALTLRLKQGAQVMFIKNSKDGLWVNGTIGRVNALGQDRVWVELESGEVESVESDIWENIQYTFDEKENKVVENVLGSFKQLPLKPAWALTVHKSQGLTFNNVLLDFAGGAFSSGQTYVALSRCTSLEGITMLKPLQRRDVIVSTAVVDFSRQFNNRQVIDTALAQEEARVRYRRAIHAFEHDEMTTAINEFFAANQVFETLSQPAVRRLIAVKLSHMTQLKQTIAQLEKVVDAQHRMLANLAREYAAMGCLALPDDVLEEPATTYGGHCSLSLDDITVRSALANFDKALHIDPDCKEAIEGKARLQALVEPQRSKKSRRTRRK